MIKTIAVPLFGAEGDDATLAAAVALAERCRAHIEAVHVTADPRASIAIAAPGMTASMIDQMVADAQREVDKRSAAARKTFASVAGALPTVEKPPGPNGASTAWREVEGQPSAWVEKGTGGCSTSSCCRTRRRRSISRPPSASRRRCSAPAGR